MVASLATKWVVEPPDVSHIVTEDDEPVDNFLSEKNQRCLVDSIYADSEAPPDVEGEGPRTFLACSNVGLFATPRTEPLVPDVFVSLDVVLNADILAKEHRTYFFWEMGKPPDVVIEIVSNKEGGEGDRKLRGYARMRVPYYVVYDPMHHLGPATLRAWELRGDLYIPIEPSFPSLGLKLAEWEGPYEGVRWTWLRWFRKDGTLVRTGAERAEAEKQRAERLAERLRALGIDPDKA